MVVKATPRSLPFRLPFADGDSVTEGFAESSSSYAATGINVSEGEASVLIEGAGDNLTEGTAFVVIAAFGENITEGAAEVGDSLFANGMAFRRAYIFRSQPEAVSISNPILRLSISDPDFRSVANGGKIRQADGSDTALYCRLSDGTEVEYPWRYEYQEEDGLFEIEIRVPTWDLNENLWFYFYYSRSTSFVPAHPDEDVYTGYSVAWDFPSGIDLTGRGNDLLSGALIGATSGEPLIGATSGEFLIGDSQEAFTIPTATFIGDSGYFSGEQPQFSAEAILNGQDSLQIDIVVSPVGSGTVDDAGYPAMTGSEYLVPSGSTLSAALSAATSGDHVVLDGSVPGSDLTIPAGVVLRGDSNQAHTITGGTLRPSSGATIHGIRISGGTIYVGQSSEASGVAINRVFFSNGLLRCANSPNLTVRRCEWASNTGRAIMTEPRNGCIGASFYDCLIRDNDGQTGQVSVMQIGAGEDDIGSAPNFDLVSNTSFTRCMVIRCGCISGNNELITIKSNDTTWTDCVFQDDLNLGGNTWVNTRFGSNTRFVRCISDNISGFEIRRENQVHLGSIARNGAQFRIMNGDRAPTGPLGTDKNSQLNDPNFGPVNADGTNMHAYALDCRFTSCDGPLNDSAFSNDLLPPLGTVVEDHTGTVTFDTSGHTLTETETPSEVVSEYNTPTESSVGVQSNSSSGGSSMVGTDGGFWTIGDISTDATSGWGARFDAVGYSGGAVECFTSQLTFADGQDCRIESVGGVNRNGPQVITNRWVTGNEPEHWLDGVLLERSYSQNTPIVGPSNFADTTITFGAGPFNRGTVDFYMDRMRIGPAKSATVNVIEARSIVDNDRIVGYGSATTQDQTRNCVAVPDYAEVEIGSSSLIDVIENDVESDGEIISVGQPTFGTTSIEGEFIRYIAPASTGEDEFSYTIQIPTGEISVGKVFVNVVEESAPPVITTDGVQYWGIGQGCVIYGDGAANTNLNETYASGGVHQFYVAQCEGPITKLLHQARHDEGYSVPGTAVFDIIVQEADPDTRLPKAGGTIYATGYNTTYSIPTDRGQSFPVYNLTPLVDVQKKDPICVSFYSKSSAYYAVNVTLIFLQSSDTQPASYFPSAPFFFPFLLDGRDPGQMPVQADRGRLRYRRVGYPLGLTLKTGDFWDGTPNFGAVSTPTYNMQLTGNTFGADRWRQEYETKTFDRLHIHAYRINNASGNLRVFLEEGPIDRADGIGTVIREYIIPGSSFINVGSEYERGNINETVTPTLINWFTLNLGFDWVNEKGKIYGIRFGCSSGEMQIWAPNRAETYAPQLFPPTQDFNQYFANGPAPVACNFLSMGAEVITLSNGVYSRQFKGGDNRKSLTYMLRQKGT